MRAQIVLKKINDLISLVLTDGVQPSDLADNIFVDSYVKVGYTKINGEVTGELVFEEEGSIRTITTLRYFYNVHRKITRIEEEVHNAKKVIWDRSHQEAQMINEIVDMMEELYSTEQIKTFIASLPENIQTKLVATSTRKRAS